jgi:hypothetical protein
MQASLEEHSILSLVQEIHAQPQALVEPLEAHLKEELAGVDMRVRDKMKIQELRNALQQKRRLPEERCRE